MIYPQICKICYKLLDLDTDLVDNQFKSGKVFKCIRGQEVNISERTLPEDCPVKDIHSLDVALTIEMAEPEFKKKDKDVLEL